MENTLPAGRARTTNARSRRKFRIALPEPGASFRQDAEWCVIYLDGQWRELRFHDYDQVYNIPGLYEQIFYDLLQCNSPTTICNLLARELADRKIDPQSLRVLDLGAGNGMVGEELRRMGASEVYGLDILEEARAAVERDRPDVYADYFVADLTAPTPELLERFAEIRPNALTCVAALGFGDIPPRAFATAFNAIDDDGWVAFTIKDEFLDPDADLSGFAQMIRRMAQEDVMDVAVQRRYQHRIATNRTPLHYFAVIARKLRDIPEELIGE